MSGQNSKNAGRNSWNKDEIRFSKNKDEDANRKKYQKKDEIQRKWFKIQGKLNEHGYTGLYESAIKEAFNLAEFVMTNYLEFFFNQRKNLPETKNVRDKVYTYEGYEQPIDWGLLDKGFAGKTELLEKVKVTLPQGTDKVRRLRNTMIHGTESYVAIDTELLKDYEWVEEKVTILGELLLAMRKISPEILRPTYADLKAKVGDVIGYNNDFTLLEVLREDSKERVFRGKESESGQDVIVTELVSEGNMPVSRYRELTDKLRKVRGNGIARTVSVVFENKTAYIVREKIEGRTLERYLAEQKPNDEQKKDILYQIRNVFKSLDKYPNVGVGFHKEDLLIDDDGIVWLTGYGIGKNPVYQSSLLEGYEVMLRVSKEVKEPEKPVEEVQEETEILVQRTPVQPMPEQNEQQDSYEEASAVYELKASSVSEEVQPVDEQENEIPTKVNGNNWNKLWITLGSCACVVLLFWAIAGLIG